MYKRLSADQKIALITRFTAGEAVSKLCSEAGVSRTIFYKWIKTANSQQPIKAKTSLAAHNPKGKKHYRKLPITKENAVVKLALQQPHASLTTIKSQAGVSKDFAWKVLKRRGLPTSEARQLQLAISGGKLVYSLPIDQRLAMIKRYEEGEKIVKLCREFGISRTLFYRWLRRYNGVEHGEKRQALRSRRPVGEGHYKHNKAAKEMVLTIIIEHPDFSLREICAEITHRAGKQLIGRQAINVLLRTLDLMSYESRLAYAHSSTAISTRPYIVTGFEKPAIPRYSYISFLPPPLQELFERYQLGYALFGVFSFLLFFLSTFLLHGFFNIQGLSNKIGTIFSFISLTLGMFFFFYSMKYYLTIAIVLSFSRKEQDDDPAEEKISMLERVFGFSIEVNSEDEKVNHGLQADLSGIVLERQPFVSIHLSTYNEKRVIDRLLTAATSMDYPNYEVIVADDSNDETVALLKKWEKHPRVKISRRQSREGYKGAALAVALKKVDPRTEFIMVFDADFIPYPDSITQFLKYFQYTMGDLRPETIRESNIASVQGYQWHVLNKSENWITRGVRSEYAGSYVIERSGTEVYGGLKQISGSVYMIRRSVLEHIGWGTSITEDFELTLKLYAAGFKVVYTPYIQAPAEAVSTLKRLIRQRMRWAEGHSFNIKRMWQQLFASPYLTLAEKFEVIYLTPYYLQAALFIAGTLAWLIAETIFQVRLPFWTEVWGWSLVLTNLFALPLMNMVGLFMEESDEKDYLGLFSFIALSYIVAPFQAYAAIKGFVEDTEGPWFRTPKTGRITDVFTPGKFYRVVSGLIGQPVGALSRFAAGDTQGRMQQYLALATAHNRFDGFTIPRKKFTQLGNFIILGAVMLTTLLFHSGEQIKQGTLADLPVHTQVMAVGENISLFSRVKMFVNPHEAIAASQTQPVVVGSSRFTDIEVVVSVAILTVLLAFSGLLYLIRRKRKLLKTICKSVVVFTIILTMFVPNLSPFLSAPYAPLEVKEVQAATTSAYTDGASVSISNAADTTLATLNTSFTNGATNVIVATVAFNRANNTVSKIVAGDLKLKDSFGTVLASNEFDIIFGTAQNTRTVYGYLLYRDTSGTASPTYTVTARADVTSTTGEAKVLALSGIPSSAFTDGTSTNIDADTSLGTTSMVPAGDNVIISALQFDNTNTSTRNIAVNAAKIIRQGTPDTTLSTNDLQLRMQGDSTTTFNSNNTLLITRDAGAAANTTYAVKAQADGSGVNAETKTIVLSGVDSAFLDGTTTSVGTTSTNIGTLSTSFAAGNVVVINGTQLDNVNVTAQTIAAGALTMDAGAGTLASNEYIVNIGPHTNVTETRSTGLLYMHSGASANTTYNFNATSSLGTLDSEVKAVALSLAPPTYTQSGYKFFANSDSTNVSGTGLAAQDTAVTAPVQGTAFRLRLLLHTADNQLGESGENFKLQIAQKVGAACNTSMGGTDEVYSDLSPSSGNVRYHNNSTPTDGDNLTSNANDPTHSSDTVRNQDYEEANNFTNTARYIGKGEDGLWDFAIVDTTATANTTYCVRVVQADGTTLSTYSVVPEFTTVPENPVVLFGFGIMLVYLIRKMKQKRVENGTM